MICETSQLNNVNTATPAIHSIVVETYDFPKNVATAFADPREIVVEMTRRR